jgi:hypothetical protein
VSEQDFFFDEEPEAKAPATKGAKAPAKTSPKASASAPAAPASASGDSTSYAVVALVGVIGLLLGAILGFVLGSTLAGNSASGPTASNIPAPTTLGTAPQLTPEQLNTTELPAGHPVISSSGTVETTPAP